MDWEFVDQQQLGVTIMPAQSAVRTPLSIRRLVPATLTLVLAVLGAFSFAKVGHLPPFAASPANWAIIAIAITASERLNVHFEAGASAHSLVLYELPFALGLVLCDPRKLLIAVTILYAIGRVTIHRQRGIKALFNVALYVFETATATLIFRALATPGHTESMRTWGALLLAISTVAVTGALSVAVVIHCVGGNVPLKTVLRQTGFHVVAGCVLGTVGLIMAAAMISLRAIVPHLLLVVVVLVGMVWVASHLNERLQRLRTLHDFSMSIALTNDTDRTIPDLLLSIQQVIQAGEVALVLIGSDGAIASRYGCEAIRFERDDDLWRSTVAERQTIVLAGSDALRIGHHDLLVAPLVRGDRVVGVLFAANRTGQVRPFDDSDVSVFTTIANNTAVALENARLIDELRDEADRRERESLHDALTGLPNRTLVSQRIDEALARSKDEGGLVGLMLLDLNRFKEVNDSLGHHVGDDLLCHVGKRIRSALAADVTVGRLGGDEFAVVVPSATTREQVLGVAHAIIGALRTPIVTEGLTISVDVAIGVSIAPDDGVGRTSLMKKADIAMYHAKGQRASSAALYSPDQEQSSVKQLAMVAALRQTLEEDRLDVAYQPKVELATGRVVGVEALCRWNHPTEGEISPARFIPLAEHAGLIGQLTTVILRRSLAQAAAWRAAGLSLTISVNLSAQSLQDPDLVPSLRATFEAANVPMSSIILEITENELMTDPLTADRLLKELRSMGVGLSIDDFGTGYSSLAYLSRLPVNEVKIDRSFVRVAASNRRDASIVDAIARLGTSLEMKVVAEGIEDLETMELLATLGVDIGQGYYIGRPMPAEAFDDWRIAWMHRYDERIMTRAINALTAETERVITVG